MQQDYFTVSLQGNSINQAGSAQRAFHVNYVELASSVLRHVGVGLIRLDQISPR